MKRVHAGDAKPNLSLDLSDFGPGASFAAPSQAHASTTKATVATPPLFMGHAMPASTATGTAPPANPMPPPPPRPPTLKPLQPPKTSAASSPPPPAAAADSEASPMQEPTPLAPAQQLTQPPAPPSQQQQQPSEPSDPVPAPIAAPSPSPSPAPAPLAPPMPSTSGSMPPPASTTPPSTGTRSPSQQHNLVASLSGILNFKNSMLVARHVLVIQQMREMVQALLRLDIPDMQSSAARVSERIARRVLQQQRRNPGGSGPSHCMDVAQVLSIKAVLKVVDGVTFFEHEGDVTPVASAAVMALRHAVFGAAAGLSEPGTMDALAFGSMDRVRSFHLSCLWLLLHCIRPSNCLRLMRLGQVLGISRLQEEAFLYSIANLRTVLEGPGLHEWLQLDAEHVAALLSNSNVQLSNELEIWEALSKWLLHSLPDRKHLVGPLLGACLRLRDMDVLQLQQLRQTQLVSTCPEAVSMVSSAYTRRIVSSVHLSQDTAGNLPAMPPLGSEPTLAPWGAAGSITISPDEQLLLKKPRLDQEATAAAVVGSDVVRRVDGVTAGQQQQ